MLPAVQAGKVYTGAATVADRPCFTAYTGLRSPDGSLIGMLYVGLSIDTVAS